MTDPREPFDTDSAVEATDLDDPQADVPGSVDLETGAGEVGAAEGSSDTADLDIATEVADETPEIESGEPDSLASERFGRGIVPLPPNNGVLENG